MKLRLRNIIFVILIMNLIFMTSCREKEVEELEATVPIEDDHKEKKEEIKEEAIEEPIAKEDEESKVISLDNDEIINLVVNATDRLFEVLRSQTENNIRYEDEYETIGGEFASLQEIENYLSPFWSTAFVENFLNTWMMEYEGQVYRRIGDLGATPEFREGTVVEVTESEGTKNIIIRAPQEWEYSDTLFVMVYEGDKWVIKSNDFVDFN